MRRVIQAPPFMPPFGFPGLPPSPPAMPAAPQQQQQQQGSAPSTFAMPFPQAPVGAQASPMFQAPFNTGLTAAPQAQQVPLMQAQPMQAPPMQFPAMQAPPAWPTQQPVANPLQAYSALQNALADQPGASPPRFNWAVGREEHPQE